MKALFDRAVAVDASQRDAWLDAAGEDQAIVDEVRSLLRYDEPQDDDPQNDDPIAARRVGTRLGAYALGPIVGSGGMGTVYAAERCDDEFRKRVAVKLVRPGMDSEPILRRFRQERQVLANLEHPGIARLIDGGVTDDGRPYLVMEFVEGAPIDVWCDERELSTEKRLELFRDVCAAVQHAHRNLVVHRDLKPGNILVDATGAAKLLDFGIAKVLEPGDDDAVAATVTHVGLRPMTPRYASPEQVRGGAVTTAADIYALGVLLYELLTGRAPYAFTTATRAEIERVVCETDPPRPSSAVADANDRPGAAALRRRLAGDLDTIVMKAMHKDPERRYASVEQLADDIRRHLDGLPVRARPDTFAYRASRFVGRHRIPVTAGAVAAIALITGFVVSTVLFVQARRAERDAVRQLDQVRAFARTMMYDVHDEIEMLPGSTPVREFLVETTLAYLDRAAGDAGDDADVHVELGDGYQRMANVKGLDTSGNLGDLTGAMRSAEKSSHHWTVAARLRPDDPALRLNRVVGLRTEGDLLVKLGRADDAGARYLEAVEVAEDVLASDPVDVRARRQLAVVVLKLGDLLEQRGRFDAARTRYERALELAASLGADHPEDLGLQRDHVIALGRLGRFETQRGDETIARSYLERRLASTQTLVDAHAGNAQFRRDLAIAHEQLGDLELQCDDREAALAHYAASLTILREQADADPESVSIRQSLSIAIEKTADVRMAGDEAAEALALYEQSLALTSSLSELDPSNARTRFYVGLCHYNVGRAQHALGDRAAAAASYERLMEICRGLLERDPDAANHFIGFVTGAVGAGEIALEDDRPDDAIALLGDARQFAQVTFDRNADHAWAREQYAACCATLAAAHERRGADAGRSRDDRLDDLRAAQRWYGIAPDEAHEDVARCEEAIAALNQ